jgi:hypothetical protein
MENLPKADFSTRATASLNDSSTAAELAKLVRMLFACYRMTETSDPETYTAAAIMVLSDYPIQIVRAVCDPRNGLPSRCKWLPSIAEIKEACEEKQGPIVRERVRRAQLEKQFAERDNTDHSKRLTVAELKAKYGEWELRD